MVVYHRRLPHRWFLTRHNSELIPKVRLPIRIHTTLHPYISLPQLPILTSLSSPIHCSDDPPSKPRKSKTSEAPSMTCQERVQLANVLKQAAVPQANLPKVNFGAA